MNIDIKHGFTGDIVFTISSDLADPTTYDLKFQVKENPDDLTAAALINKTVDINSSKVATVALASIDWTNIVNKNQTLYYGTLVFKTGENFPFLQGEFRVTRSYVIP